MPVITAQISSDTIAVSCGVEIKSPSPVLALCRKLIDAGCPSSAPLEAYLGDMLCLTIRSIGEAANLEVNSGGTGFIRQSGPRSAPPISATLPSSLAA